MIAQKTRNSRGSGRTTPAYKVEYALPTDNAPHNTPSMAQAWGRLAARLGWDLEQGLKDEVATAYHQIARNAYHSKQRRAA